MINFLWINAINSVSEVETRYPHLGIGYLIAVLEKTFGEDIFRFKVSDTHISETIETFQPDIIGISCVSQNYTFAREYAREAKKQGIPVIIGGVHISSLPHTLSKDMDIGCIGEGEETIIELMRVYLAHKAFPQDKLTQILGIIFRDHEGILHQTSPRLLRKNLDEIPLPAREYLRTSSHAYMFTSRGCPYRCTFCFSSRFWQNVRFFSAQRVVTEIESLINTYHAKFISFFDDLFVANKLRFFEIVDLLVEKKIVGTVKFSCSLRANTITEEVAQGLKRMGVVSVGMGLESGNQRILSWLKGSGITVKHNRQAVALLRKYGIQPNASFVIGSPDETKEEILDTLHFIKSVDVGLFDVYVLTPLPGTPVWDIAKAKGIVSENDLMDWGKLNVNFETHPQDAIILSDCLSRNEIISLYQKFRRYRLFHNIKKIWTHPMLSDVPRYAVKIAGERISRILLKSK